MSRSTSRYDSPGVGPAAANRLHLGCDEDYREGWCNVDINPDVPVDARLDVTATPWPFPDEQFRVVEANHLIEHFDRETIVEVFRESSRVLVGGGLLRVTVPFGVNYRMDDDHETRWTWESPVQYSRLHARNWDSDVPFELVDREVHSWFIRPLGFFNPLLAVLACFWPGLWATELPLAGGELTAVYRRCEDEN